MLFVRIDTLSADTTMLVVALYLFKKHAVVEVIAPKSDETVIDFKNAHHREFYLTATASLKALESFVHNSVARSR